MTDPYVTETFTTFQGSGHLMGTRQHFVRFAGCSAMKCPIRSACDEPDALTRKTATQRSVDSILLETYREVGPRGWLHITGGEPTDQSIALQELAMEARTQRFYVHLQTNGIRRAPIQWDWITVSPKVDADNLEQRFGQEMIVVDDGTVSSKDLADYKENTKFWCYYLQPLWEFCDPERTTELARKAGWMVTTQLHKHWGFR